MNHRKKTRQMICQCGSQGQYDKYKSWKCSSQYETIPEQTEAANVTQ